MCYLKMNIYIYIYILNLGCLKKLSFFWHLKSLREKIKMKNSRNKKEKIIKKIFYFIVCCENEEKKN